jgi:hypothetical protein
LVDRHRVTRILAASLVLVAIACKKPPPPLPSEADAAVGPRDHLAPGELAEGPDKALSLPLPRVARVTRSYRDEVHVSSSAAPEEVANFVAARVKSGKRIVGTTTTTFEDVVVPASPKTHLSIEIRAGAPGEGRSTMIVRDVTVGPPAAIPTDEAWKKAGMTPDGRLIDPKHTQ